MRAMVVGEITAERMRAPTLRAESVDGGSVVLDNSVRGFGSDEPLPRPLGRYVLVEQIGAGPNGRIFRGVNVCAEGFRRVVAIKRAHAALASSPEAFRGFMSMARAGAMLNHPFIAQLYEIGADDADRSSGGERFLVLEHVDGIDLARVLRSVADRGRTVPCGAAALICRQAAEALYHAHTARGRDGRLLEIVHRNLTPANVMLARSGVVKLLGFGGTARQPLSPEQALAQPPDARSDVFALGAILWELLAGRRPFGADRGVAGDNGSALVRRALEGPLPPPSFYNPAVPPVLEQVALRALDRDPAHRYQTAQDMGDDLGRFLQGEPFESRPIANLLDEIDRPGPVLRPALYASPSLLAPEPPRARPPFSRLRHRGPRPAMLVGAACVLLAAAAVIVAAVGRLAPASVPLPALATARDATAEVAIDITSDPPGVDVQGTRGALGRTPLRIRLPIAQEVEHLVFERPGYQPQAYDVRPRSAGAVFVELQPIRTAAR
jgi:serine/threonine protein kinase